MAEPKNPITREMAEKTRDEDFQRAEARRQEITARRLAKEAARTGAEAPDWFPLSPATIWHLPVDPEPTFTFRAQDILSVMVLDNYARLLEMYEPNGAKTVQVIDELNRFRAWQQANPGKVKLPD